MCPALRSDLSHLGADRVQEKGGRDWEREARKPGPVEGERPKTAARPRDPRSERRRGRVLTRDARRASRRRLLSLREGEKQKPQC